jgi:hypothetical protein
MRMLVCYPHGLGDCVLLTPVLRDYFHLTGKKMSVATMERFRSSMFFDNNPYVDEIFYTKDAWNDFQNEHIGFQEVYKYCQNIASERGYTHVIFPRHQAVTEKIHSNYLELGVVQPINPTTEIYPTPYDVRVADEIIEKCVGNNDFGFIHSNTGVPIKDLPEGYGKMWLKKYRDLEHTIEVGVDFEALEYPITVQFEIMRKARAVCLPDSVFYHACGAMHKPVDFVYFARGKEIYDRVKPLHQVLQNINLSLDKV